jgi:K+ transporter
VGRKSHGDLHLIAGYRDDRPVDEERLRRVNGRVALAVGALTLLTGLAYLVLGIDADDQVAFWGGYTLLLCALAAYAMHQSRAARIHPDR